MNSPTFLIKPLILAFTLLIYSCEEAQKCQVHNIELDEKEIDIAYGLMLVTYDYTNSYSFQVAQDSLFPNEYLKSWTAGGCIIGPEDELDVEYCSACNKAHTNWINTNADIVSYWENLPDSVAWIEADAERQRYTEKLQEKRTQSK